MTRRRSLRRCCRPFWTACVRRRAFARTSSLCSLACPNQAIKLKIVPDAKKKRHMQSYIHLVGRCLYCNLCVEACNTHALSWDKNYAISS
ncbi:MAG: 4Fe-4S dicluster domain-containing protein, partial [Firmicutes bacterium]|nr:4Fe-4S dicluster domain-containing protein [Bacillota bacterium]